LLGALCISLATSWALVEVFGWAHSLNRGVREAPWFYVAYVLMLMSAGVVSLIATVDVQNIITIFVQVVAVTLLPAALMFLILLLNDKPLMGEYVNTRWQNIANWSIVAFVITVSTLYGVSILFPDLFNYVFKSIPPTPVPLRKPRRGSTTGVLPGRPPWPQISPPATRSAMGPTCC